jgi:hypothetical protein
LPTRSSPHSSTELERALEVVEHLMKDVYITISGGCHQEWHAKEKNRLRAGFFCPANPLISQGFLWCR